jgi:hypothetical protein
MLSPLLSLLVRKSRCCLRLIEARAVRLRSRLLLVLLLRLLHEVLRWHRLRAWRNPATRHRTGHRSHDILLWEVTLLLIRLLHLPGCRICVCLWVPLRRGHHVWRDVSTRSHSHRLTDLALLPHVLHLHHLTLLRSHHSSVNLGLHRRRTTIGLRGSLFFLPVVDVSGQACRRRFLLLLRIVG